jgi:ligand-binding sensor domain-containing protein
MRPLTLIFFLMLFSSLLQAQKPFIQDVWLNENRTPMKANALLMDKDGYMIVGTDQGLYKYNGKVLKMLKSSVAAPVTSLSLQQGKVWVGFKNGKFGYLQRDSVSIPVFTNYKASSQIHTIVVRPDSAIWLGTEEGIIQIYHQNIKRYNTSTGLSDDFIYTLTFIDDATILAGTDQGLNIIHLSPGKDKVSVFSAEQGLQDNIVRVIEKAGILHHYWIGAQQGGLAFYDSGKKHCYPLKVAGGWKWGQVNDILTMSSSRAYAATEDGYLLELLMNGTDSAMVSATYMPGTRINALINDNAGNLWCGTDKGISLITAEFLNFIPLSDPFSLTDVTAIGCDKNNRLWLALKKDVFYSDLNKGDHNLQKVFKAKEPVSVIYCDKNGTLWLGTSGDGLWVKEVSAGTFKKVADPLLARENILSLTVIADQLWISGLNGVKQFDMDGSNIRLVKTHNKASGIGSDYIYQLFGDSKGRLWMATDGAGVSMYHKNEYYHWNAFDSASNAVAYTITEDAGGGIWAGTLYTNLFRYKDGQWTNLRKHEVQDIDVNLFTVNANATGQVVAVYQRCVDLWYPGSKFFRHFNSRHNMGLDSTSRVLNCGTRDNEGNVYIPYQKGLLVFKNQLANYDIRPGVSITGISNNLKNISTLQHEYSPDENYMSFYFDGISFTNPERLNYRFRLEGYSDNWVYTNELSATFPKLPSGTFTFRVQVSLNGTFDHASEASYVFTITAPLWRKPWFILLASLLIIAVSYAIIKYRDRKLQRLALLEQEKIAFDYEHLKSQVNPHFLFNSLNTLTSLIEDNQGDAVAYTERLSDLYRNMLTYHNKDLITLGEEWEILSAYLYIQQSRFGKALQIKGIIPEAFKASARIPPMALQLLVENAIKHNVVSVSSPLIIEVIVDEKEITISNKINPKIRREMESGIGLANITNRYAMLTRRKVYYGKEGENWVVKLPLL